MHDIRWIRQNPEAFAEAMARRGKNVDMPAFLAMDENRRKLLGEVEALKARRNEVSDNIPRLKKAGQDVGALMDEMKSVGGRIKKLDEELATLDDAISQWLLSAPNRASEQVPEGLTEESNIEIRKWGNVRQFDFEPKPHWDIGESLGILDFAAAARITGARFTVYRGLGARLERALIHLMLQLHTDCGYEEVLPPYMVHRSSMVGTGQLPKFEEDAFKVAGTEYFMIPTAEVPVTNLYREQILDAATLPIKHCAYSACFRAEAGSAGRDTRGLIRQHQFNKVELVKFAAPETSYDELETLTADAERVLQALELPYRVVRLCAGDLGFASAMTYDLEVFMPSYNRYVEISSCSNYEDFQARRANIKYRPAPQAKPTFVHTLNGSGVAVGRALACVLETYQRPDGKVDVPKALIPFMGTDVIG